MKTAFLSVDPQSDFCEGGKLPVDGGEEVMVLTTDHVKRKQSSNDPYDFLLASKDSHVDPGDHWSDNPDWTNSFPEHCGIGTEGHEFHPALDINFDAVFYKGAHEAAFSAFEGVNPESGLTLDAWLIAHEVDTLYVSGLAMDFCVSATVKSALECNYRTILLADLTASVNPERHYHVAQDLSNLGAEVVIGVP